MGLKGVIFDVDGVIIDTAPVHHKSWKETFKNYGIKKFTFLDFKNKIDGMPRAKGVLKIFPGLDEKTVKKICEEKQIYFNGFLKKEGVKKFSSTVKLMKDLKKAGILLCMASSSKNARHILESEGIYDLFDADAEGSEVKRGKPYPDIFLKAAKKLKLKAEECIVIEDSQAGIDAAVAAKIKCVGVSREHALKGADLTVKDLKEVSVKKLLKLAGG